ncbi:hypothetical protein BT67DRAFT_255643 [Trichocladium antarcticum]|uniref:Uncharacterized protein n=1 Tax=Trichocladium antarcticum TaxID=1450529 RepID=A0AAN6ZFB2_9PEZI|nr:hypothetical protein BT67DRAFT_255643 [Trichocladium antarcticum]
MQSSQSSGAVGEGCLARCNGAGEALVAMRTLSRKSYKLLPEHSAGDVCGVRCDSREQMCWVLLAVMARVGGPRQDCRRASDRAIKARRVCKERKQLEGRVERSGRVFSRKGATWNNCTRKRVVVWLGRAEGGISRVVGRPDGQGLGKRSVRGYNGRPASANRSNGWQETTEATKRAQFNKSCSPRTMRDCRSQREKEGESVSARSRPGAESRVPLGPNVYASRCLCRLQDRLMQDKREQRGSKEGAETEFHRSNSLVGRESGWWTVFALVKSLGGRGGPRRSVGNGRP